MNTASAGTGSANTNTTSSGDVSDDGSKAEVRSYYGQPILAEPVWTWEVPAYFFTGGLAGASSVLAAGARLAGNGPVARAAERTALAGALASPALLTSDLGRPERFHHMLRVFKPTSPMNLGSWLLAAYAPAAAGTAVLRSLRLLPRVRRGLAGLAGLLGPAMATYTAVLASDTAVPAWHEARRELPFVFAGSAASAAGAAASMQLAPSPAGPAHRLVFAGVAVESVAEQAMDHRLGELGEPYHQGEAGRTNRLATAASAAGSGLLAVRGARSRVAAAIAGALVLVGSAAKRWAVFKAGQASARDPKYVVKPQRERANMTAGADG